MSIIKLQVGVGWCIIYNEEGSMANKNMILKQILFCSRVVILISLIFSLVFYDKYVFATFFIIAGCLELCENLLSIKDVEGRVVLDIFSNIVGRLVFLLPLLFLTISKALTAWVFVILVFFEIVIAFYRRFTVASGKLKFVINCLYFCYVILLWLSIFIWCFNTQVATVMLVCCSVLAGIYIITCSAIVKDDEETEEDILDKKEVDTRSEIEKDLDSDKNQLIE